MHVLCARFWSEEAEGFVARGMQERCWGLLDKKQLGFTGSRESTCPSTGGCIWKLSTDKSYFLGQMARSVYLIAKMEKD